VLGWARQNLGTDVINSRKPDIFMEMGLRNWQNSSEMLRLSSSAIFWNF
jgi:hypothetical protein